MTTSYESLTDAELVGQVLDRLDLMQVELADALCLEASGVSHLLAGRRKLRRVLKERLIDMLSNADHDAEWRDWRQQIGAESADA